MKSHGALSVALATLVASNFAVLIFETNAIRSRREVSVQPFQRLVGGFGLGPATDLSGCAFGLDPRLEGSCSLDYGPIPGGACFCPRHAMSVFYYSPLKQGFPLRRERAGNAPAR